MNKLHGKQVAVVVEHADVELEASNPADGRRKAGVEVTGVAPRGPADRQGPKTSPVRPAAASRDLRVDAAAASVVEAARELAAV